MKRTNEELLSEDECTEARKWVRTHQTGGGKKPEKEPPKFPAISGVRVVKEESSRKGTRGRRMDLVT